MCSGCRRSVRGEDREPELRGAGLSGEADVPPIRGAGECSAVFEGAPVWRVGELRSRESDEVGFVPALCEVQARIVSSATYEWMREERVPGKPHYRLVTASVAGDV
jgi:hypothetical protein